MTKLLARFADCVFWLARYVERANSLARVLDVNQTYSYDAKGGRNWQVVLRLYTDEDEFNKRYPQVTAENVLAFYVTDANNPSSIRSCVRAARENARTIRPLISTEMWTHLNVFYEHVKAVDPAEVTAQSLSELCGAVKEGCQTHVGITRETFYRDEAWAFYIMGQQLERADQTTRLLDVKYQQLLPKAVEAGSALDVSQWHALLRAAAGFQAFRREHPSRTTPEAVASFLLFNPRFPRSLLCAVNEAANALSNLKQEFGLRNGNLAQKHLRSLQAQLMDMTIEDVLSRGLHDTVDWAQRELNEATALVRGEFCGVA